MSVARLMSPERTGWILEKEAANPTALKARTRAHSASNIFREITLYAGSESKGSFE
jgi:hypothetical protein